MSHRSTSLSSVGFLRVVIVVSLVLLTAVVAIPMMAATQAQATATTYQNPLPIEIAGDGQVDSCADPSIIYGQKPGDGYWYAYCTKDPLNDDDLNASGEFNFRVIPIVRSRDLANWEYVGPVFEQNPAWVTPNAGVFAPSIEYFPEIGTGGTYYLYYSVTDVAGGGNDEAAIGVATAPSPTGPWTDKGSPVVEPHQAPCCAGSKRATINPEVIQFEGKRYIYYGSYFGGISMRELSTDGMSAPAATQRQIIVDNKYEGPYLFQHGNFWYIFLSATDCCRGPSTGYSVFAGRAETPFGPFVDREGVSLCEPVSTGGSPQENSCQIGYAGGSPVLSMNGNRWIGPGHNAVFTDFAGQDWTIYHAIDRNDPFFPVGPGFGAEPEQNRLTKRPLMLDPIDWIDGWPTVRGGHWASDSPQPAPAAQPGDPTNYRMQRVVEDRPGTLLAGYSEEFTGTTPTSDFLWVREPISTTYGLEPGGPNEAGVLRFNTQDADINRDQTSASVLIGEKRTDGADWGETPFGDYLVETKVRFDVPATGCCFNFRQAGLVIYGDDDNYLKLTHTAIFNTRQTEFGREVGVGLPGTDRYGNTVVGPPAETTWLRIAKRTVGNEEHYQAYSSIDGVTWERGGVWTHTLGGTASIGLVSMGGSGSIARFDYVRVYQLLPTTADNRTATAVAGQTSTTIANQTATSIAATQTPAAAMTATASAQTATAVVQQTGTAIANQIGTAVAATQTAMAMTPTMTTGPGDSLKVYLPIVRREAP